MSQYDTLTERCSVRSGHREADRDDQVLLQRLVGIETRYPVHTSGPRSKPHHLTVLGTLLV